MNAKATVSCSCSCMFQVGFQNSSLENPPCCPQCKAIMDKASWESLRNVMAQIVDFNHHIIKWNSERNEPRMLVPAITASTFED